MQEEQLTSAATTDNVSNEKNIANPGIFRAVDLVKRYGQRTVVNQVSIEVHPGEVVGLLGPNGAGKTTSFYMMVGLVHPNEGKVYLGEKEITKQAMYRRARLGLGYLPQESSIFRKLTVEQNMHAILEMRGMKYKERKPRVEKLLEEFRLTERRAVAGGLLSGGERRRTEIARTLACEPSYILLDEPFTGIDPIAVEEIQTIVRTLRDKGIGVLITDHNVLDTLAITERVYIIYEGQIMTHGTPDEIANDPMARKYYLSERFSR